jgi:hypothetical protein
MLNRVVIVVVALAEGCGTSLRATMINPAPHAMQPRPPQTVEMFSSGPPHRPYIDVAYLEAEQEASYSLDGTSDFIAQLHERAAQMGCNGVVLGGVTNAPDAVASVTANINASRKGTTAICIMYLPEAVAAKPPPAAVQPATAAPAVSAPSGARAVTVQPSAPTP